MTDANAEQDEFGTLDDGVQEEATDTEPTESSEAVDSSPQEDAPKQLDDTAQDAVNKRIGVVTAEKWQEKRRADALQKQLDELNGKPKEEKPADAPKLDDFEDFDDFQVAQVAHQVQTQVSQALAKQNDGHKQQQAAQATQQVVAAFDKKEIEYAGNNPTYAEDVANMPTFNDETLLTIYSLENVPQVAQYLGKNLEVADSIANASPMQAAVQLGQIASRLTAKATKEVDVSKAPDPVDSLTGAGSAITEKEEPLLRGATFE